tara:strand:- start:25 stop:189 length:165 start_codon:yes stop_codon:yes gene_type:complete
MRHSHGVTVIVVTAIALVVVAVAVIAVVAVAKVVFTKGYIHGHIIFIVVGSTGS